MFIMVVVYYYLRFVLYKNIFFFFYLRKKNYILCFFFFQAEDGIRDLYETGVQTCALPISSTNLQTARPFVFSKHFMGDSALTFAQTPVRFLPAGFPLARAVMASSCVPGAFSP